jgi:hypothetical protein
MRTMAASLLLAAALAACRQAETYDIDEAPTENDLAAFEQRANAVQATGPGEPGGLPDDRNLVEEGPIDPKGGQGAGQGAGQVLQSYAALLEQGRFGEARRLWTEGGGGSGLDRQGFEQAHSKYAEIHAEIGAPGAVEGAAGSVYVEIPVRFYGRRTGGQPFNSPGSATLRRINDVPGSTEEQRRWQIYRVEVQPPL